MHDGDPTTPPRTGAATSLGPWTPPKHVVTAEGIATLMAVLALQRQPELEPEPEPEPEPEEYVVTLANGTKIHLSGPPQEKSPARLVKGSINRHSTDACAVGPTKGKSPKLEGDDSLCFTPPKTSRTGLPATPWSAASTAAFTGSPSADHTPDDEGCL